jgi:hypothetical protein
MRLVIVMLCVFLSWSTLAQRFSMGLNFQYSPLRQINVDADKVMGTYSHDIFQVKNKGWDIYSAYFLLGAELQMDYKKFYATLGLYYNLNTFNYSLYYPISPEADEKVTFQNIYFELDVPVLVGYQFLSSGIYRVSVLGGVVPSLPYNLSANLKGSTSNNNYYARYSNLDMKDILYNGNPYVNGLVGVGLHIASLAKFDVRYQQQIGSPSKQYQVSIQTIGISLTFYLPLNLRKKRIYYEE